MRFPRFTASLATLALAAPAMADFRLNLEEPVNFGTASGVANVRGWAISDEGIESIELFVDGEFAFEIPYGSERTDVQAAFPDVEGSLDSGFGATFNYGNLGPGQHSLTVRAVEVTGDTVEATSNFQVVAFSETFLVGDQPFDVSVADADINQQTGVITVEDVRLGTVEYDFNLKWSEAAQAFVMTALWVSDDDIDDDDDFDDDSDDDDSDDDRGDAGEFEFEGVVDAVVPNTSITVAGLTYEVDANTAYFIDNQGRVSADAFFAAVSVGDRVEVTDYLPEDGIADELYLEDPRD
ncbi:MAG: DUF5666 domain-containing protein [Halieaceae bacterium]|jgi:hypothetical protein|nr:DUF5666 domain-containing protein [Halieaceae bacterium]